MTTGLVPVTSIQLRLPGYTCLQVLAVAICLHPQFSDPRKAIDFHFVQLFLIVRLGVTTSRLYASDLKLEFSVQCIFHLK